MSFIEAMDRGQLALLPPCIDDYFAPDWGRNKRVRNRTRLLSTKDSKFLVT
ncbi:hypothetical protein FHX09_005436 [Rhizobium sp. BK538]|nr:hypothetical protein [Rhizobium sp. BK060]MBB4171542.1 hypothetical protein [Rhizobium sp. BK538]TCM71195.1 hypothetical protein EV291_12347 [Rhizobium sp. BK068]